MKYLIIGKRSTGKTYLINHLSNKSILKNWIIFDHDSNIQQIEQIENTDQPNIILDNVAYTKAEYLVVKGIVSKKINVIMSTSYFISSWIAHEEFDRIYVFNTKVNKERNYAIFKNYISLDEFIKLFN